MKLRSLLLASLVAGAALAAPAAFAQAKEQFFPLLSYRTGPYAPNGTPWANGKQDYLKMINARDGGINGVKLTYEECETGYVFVCGVVCFVCLLCWFCSRPLVPSRRRRNSSSRSSRTAPGRTRRKARRWKTASRTT